MPVKAYMFPARQAAIVAKHLLFCHCGAHRDPGVLRCHQCDCLNIFWGVFCDEPSLIACMRRARVHVPFVSCGAAREVDYMALFEGYQYTGADGEAEVLVTEARGETIYCVIVYLLAWDNN
ncbi:hypothetical protein ESCO_003397 [Escovopsis weberi]|uniref:Uncharacterized protein n=1 Tax=Escovopsis weberi TaxID=150374 RepID=A0A0M9VXN8_ESCWE|nr:hypothetical protein ESCO_003397 [Escovopsis weberi]